MNTNREIINTFDQLKKAGGGIGIIYRNQQLGRASVIAAFQVLRIGEDGKEIQTDPKAHWSDYGRKTFIVGHPILERKPLALEQAAKWVKEHLGDEGPWVRNRMGDYVPAQINQQFPLRKRHP